MNKTFPIELSEELHKQLKHAAVDEGVTLHAWILRTLTEKLGNQGDADETSVKRIPDHARRNRYS